MRSPETEKRISDCSSLHNYSPRGSDGPFLRRSHCKLNSDEFCQAEKEVETKFVKLAGLRIMWSFLGILLFN